MSNKVVIIDYQLGNLFSVKQACEYLGFESTISSNPADLKEASYAILPGVGAFADAMENLRSFGMVDGILEYVNAGRPLMGVCLGLHLLLTESDEFGSTKGLDLIPGRVKKFNVEEVDGQKYKVPQIQWNLIHEPVPGKWADSPLRGCKSGDFMYFVHSYYAEPTNKDFILSGTEYGTINYCSSVLKDNVFATQFHPEKSGLYGVNIYKEWFKLYSK